MAETLDFIDRLGAERGRLQTGLNPADVADLLRVMRLSAHLDRDLAETCDAFELTASQFRVLAALRRRDPLPMNATELAEAAMLTSGAMTPVLDKLEAQGLVIRQLNEADRRARRITITAKGTSLISRAIDRQVARHRAINAVLTMAEREALSALLRKLLVAMEGEAA